MRCGGFQAAENGPDPTPQNRSGSATTADRRPLNGVPREAGDRRDPRVVAGGSQILSAVDRPPGPIEQNRPELGVAESVMPGDVLNVGGAHRVSNESRQALSHTQHGTEHGRPKARDSNGYPLRRMATPTRPTTYWGRGGP